MNLLEQIPIEFHVFLTAMLPVIELRGAIPVGIAAGLSPVHSFVISYLGSTLIVPFLLLFIRPVFSMLRQNKKSGAMVDRVIRRTTLKTNQIKRVGMIGLFFFVAIPMPGSGVWSGCLIASLLNLPIRRAWIPICLGNFVAGLIILTLSYGVHLLI